METAKAAAQGEVVLRMEGIHKAFPGVQALSNMTLDLRHGEVHAICGENGAGKSTLMKLITGVYQPDSGGMTLNGERLWVRNPNHAYAKGIAIIFQETSLFPDLTILENIFMGHELTRSLFGVVRRLDYGAMRNKARALFGRLGMDPDLDARVAELSVATKQMVEIAKALSFDSRILILDEPTAALTSKEVGTLFLTIRRLKADGVSMLYISHRLDEIFQIADWVTVIRDGEHVRTEAVEKVNRDTLVSWMVGRTLHNLYPKEEVEIGEVIFEARGLRQDGILHGADLTLRRGEILGISGLAGAGRTELALALCGLTRLDAGEIRVDGVPQSFHDYQAAMARGLVYVSEDRQKYGLVVPMTVAENITFPLLRRLCGLLGLVDRRREQEIHEELRGRAVHQGPRDRLRGREPLGWQPAEGPGGEGAGDRAAHPDPRRAHERRGRGGEERDPPDHQRAGQAGEGHHHDLERPSRDPGDERPRPRHEGGAERG